MAGPSPSRSEPHALRGAVDRGALIEIRDLYSQREPLSTPTLDDFINPTELNVDLSDGLLTASTARIDVQWTTQNDYKFHYTDSEEINFRWGRHPHNNSFRHVPGLEHYHPPPNATSDPDQVQESCIQQIIVKLTTLAVQKLWRTAYHSQSLTPLNTGTNPP